MCQKKIPKCPRNMRIFKCGQGKKKISATLNYLVSDNCNIFFVGKQFVYDCIRFKFDTKHRIKVDRMPLGRTKKAYKQVTNFKLCKSCLGQDRALVSDVECDYERKRVKKTIYNQNGNVESILYLTYPFEDIFEKKTLYRWRIYKDKMFCK